jgi:RHH-type proline utilization regulon transcriptional repressor/proline dehydrogenase/delta 1-pyrroline-5-carboxylate dehydrogenase
MTLESTPRTTAPHATRAAAGGAPTGTPPAGLAPIDGAIADEAVALVRAWLAAARDEKVDSSARNLAGVLRDPHGLAFTVGFVDGVVRPEDTRVAARTLAGLVPLIPRFLPAPLRGLIRVGAFFAPILPDVVVPASRAVLRRMVRHLIVDARENRLGAALARITGEGTHLNVNLLGEAILGQREAERRLAGTRRLLERDDVDYVSIKVSSTVAPHSPWAFDEAVTHAVAALTPLYEIAERGGKFINLDMEEYKDLDLTIAVFTTILEDPRFRDLEAGIVLQAYLPDALGAMMRLQEWAGDRVARGGAPIKVRVVKGANLPMEQVDAEAHGWPLATWPSKQHSDASYKAVLDYALHPDRIGNLRLGIAGHNLFDIALAWLLARRRGVEQGVEFEMLLGMATAQAAVVRRDVGSLLLYTPVVHPDEFDVAIAYLIRRLEEGASRENFMSAVFDLDTDAALFERERQRFLASIDLMPTEVPAPNRTQNRQLPPQPGARDGFVNAPDTDPSLAANRAWAAAIRARMAGSTLGAGTLAAHTVTTAEQLDGIVSETVAGGRAWRELGTDARAQILHRAGDVLEARRAELLEVMGAECGKVIEQGDPEVSEAVDFAHYYADSSARLAAVDGAVFRPAGLTLVTPPWNFPVAIPAGSTLAALAAGSPVILKPAPQAGRCGAVLAEALWEAGVPRDVLRFVQVDEGELGRRLIADERVQRVILTGAYETAELFHSFRPALPLLAETSGKNAIIVTPSADLDLAAKDVAYSAFGHAGQKCSAASLVVLVGSVATSERFRRQLLDAVEGYEVGMPWEGPARIGPLVQPAEGKLARALTELEPGQRWLLEPERLDDAGALWRPGIREDVRPGSEFHRTEYFGPVLGIMTAGTLDEAIDIVNAVEYGLTSGLHALDEAEIARWLERIEAGNAYVNRGTTGAIVQRQPFGGWKKSAVGPGTKAGGPSYLFGLGSWADAPVAQRGRLDEPARRALAAVPGDDWLAAALATDVVAWQSEFGLARDVQDLSLEQNVLRYGAVPVTIRFESGGERELVRVVAAGARAGAPLTVSTAGPVSPAVAAYLEAVGAAAAVEDAAAWSSRAAGLGSRGGRVRLIGGSAADVAAATAGAPHVAVYAGPVVSAGRVELLTFVREQAVSITAHRFGNPRRYAVPPLAG